MPSIARLFITVISPLRNTVNRSVLGNHHNKVHIVRVPNILFVATSGDDVICLGLRQCFPAPIGNQYCLVLILVLRVKLGAVRLVIGIPDERQRRLPLRVRARGMR